MCSLARWRHGDLFQPRHSRQRAGHRRDPEPAGGARHQPDHRRRCACACRRAIPAATSWPRCIAGSARNWRCRCMARCGIRWRMPSWRVQHAGAAGDRAGERPDVPPGAGPARTDRRGAGGPHPSGRQDPGGGRRGPGQGSPRHVVRRLAGGVAGGRCERPHRRSRRMCWPKACPNRWRAPCRRRWRTPSPATSVSRSTTWRRMCAAPRAAPRRMPGGRSP